jgi:hypothetical protein
MFCAAVAVLFGGALSICHSFAEGWAPDPALALGVWLMFAGIAVVTTGTALSSSASSTDSGAKPNPSPATIGVP